ncbi:MAG: hypothetical protein QM783_20555 [Phycisphaerales bacterium]
MDRELWRFRSRMWRLFAILFLAVAGSGFFIDAQFGPLFGATWLVAGALGAVGAVFLYGVWFVYRVLRPSKQFAVIQDSLRALNADLDALSPEQARLAVCESIERNAVVSVVPASGNAPLPGTMHNDVQRLFGAFERLTVQLPVMKGHTMVFDKALVAPFTHNSDGVVIGYWGVPEQKIVVHTATGRTSLHRPPFSPGELAKAIGDPVQSRPSLWHFLLSHLAHMESALSRIKPTQPST